MNFMIKPGNGSPDAYVETVAEVLHDAVGAPVKVVGVLRDITEQKKAEEEVRLAGEWFRNIYATSPIAIEIFDDEGILLDINPACCQLFGIDSCDAVKGFNLFKDPNVPPRQKGLLQSGTVLHYESDFDFDLVQKQGLYRTTRSGVITIDVHIAPVREKNGLISRYLVQIVDITDRKKAENALRRSNSQLNLLLSVTRHDIRNQLITLNAYLCLSQKTVDDREKTLEYIHREEKIIGAIERQITFTKEYQDLGISPPAWQNADQCIRLAIKGINLGDIRLEIVGLETTEIMADPLLRKVFFNLVDNTLWHGGDMMKNVRFSGRESGSSFIIICEDDGAGIRPDEKEDIFVRGYGRNSGYGLFFIREILGITGITIKETGEPGHGARFELTVPEGAWRFADP